MILPKDYIDKEISILMDVNHPNIIELKEIKKKENKIYLVMEYCNGGTVEKFLEKYQEDNKKPLSEEIVQYIMRQIVEGMKYLSNKKIMHRHINLDNILIIYEDENDKKNNKYNESQNKNNRFWFFDTFKKRRFSRFYFRLSNQYVSYSFKEIKQLRKL